MADSKITSLTEATSLSDGGLLYCVESPLTTPVSRKIKKSNFLTGMATQGNLDIHTNNVSNPHQVTLAQLYAGTLTEYADNTAALAAGLVAGKLYRNGDFVCVVH